jgi:hypothetical protein
MVATVNCVIKGFEESRIVMCTVRLATAFEWTIKSTSIPALVPNKPINRCHCRTICSCECEERVGSENGIA